MRCIRDMRLIPVQMRDNLGSPLLPDLEPEQYLSPCYTRNDLNLLTSYGLQKMNTLEFLDRLERDINNGASSVMRDPNTNDGWHTSMASFLIAMSGPMFQKSWKMIRKLDLVPLIGGSWACAVTMPFNPVYFTHVQGYALPTDGIFNLVAPSAERNTIRKRLFGLLGVQEASLQDARRRIADRNRLSFPGLEISRSHLQFLYLTSHLNSENQIQLSRMECKLMDKESRTKSWSTGTWYFPDEGPYSPQQLLDGCEPTPLILHPHYMHDCPEKPEQETRSWRAWLRAVFMVSEVIPLTSYTWSACGSSGFRRLSPECLYVARSCSHGFLPFLLRSWNTWGENFAIDPILVKALLDIEVLCENGRMYPLGKTYVRTPQVQYVDRFLRDGEFFPWLKVVSSDEEVGLPDIRVLTTALGFGYPKSDLELYITILEFVADANKDMTGVVDPSRIFDIYTRIETRYHESVTRDVSAEMIVYVSHGPCICVAF